MSGAESRSRAPEGSDAGSTEEQSVHAIGDEPAIRLDGHPHRLKPGNGVGFRAGTGIAHGFLNNTQRDVRLLVVGEHEHADDRFTLFLAELRAHVAPDAHAIVALDGAGWHTARDPRWPGNVTPLPLPVF